MVWVKVIAVAAAFIYYFYMGVYVYIKWRKENGIDQKKKYIYCRQLLKKRLLGGLHLYSILNTRGIC